MDDVQMNQQDRHTVSKNACVIGFLLRHYTSTWQKNIQMFIQVLLMKLAKGWENDECC